MEEFAETCVFDLKLRVTSATRSQLQSTVEHSIMIPECRAQMLEAKVGEAEKNERGQ